MSYVQERSAFRLTSGLMAVLFVHAGLLLALKNGLVPHFFADKLTETTLVDVPLPPPDPTPLDQPRLADPTPFPVQRELPPAPDPIPLSENTESPAPNQWFEPRVGEGPVVPEQPVLTNPRVDPRYPLTRPDYPASAIRLGKVGRVTLLLYVLPNGQVAEAKVSRSSGYTPLDAAAVREAKRAWRFLPATSDGSPIGGWITYSVTFELTN